MATITVTRVGVSASFQDLGRPGYSDMGLGSAGAADREAAAVANRLLGNRPDAAVIESVLGSLDLRVDATVFVVVTGASCPIVVDRADGRRPRGAGVRELIALSPGDTLHVGAATSGLRTYVAVRGGFDAEMVLGSRSWDTLARLGPAPIAAGDRVPVGAGAECDEHWPVVDSVPPPWSEQADGAAVVLTATVGPRDDWFTDTWRDTLTDQTYRIGSDSDRIGMRLEGDRAFERCVEGELPSEGVETGSLQVPPEGFPVLFLVDHPVTGGYPVVAVLTPPAVDRAAQLRPGDAVSFRLVG